jgi:hypothetical protein
MFKVVGETVQDITACYHSLFYGDTHVCAMTTDYPTRRLQLTKALVENMDQVWSVVWMICPLNHYLTDSLNIKFW